jgi:polyphenol oxidase
MAKNDFISKKYENIIYYTSGAIENLGFIKHFFSTRIVGNLGIYTDDLKETINYNLNRIFKATGMNFNKKVYLHQQHSNIFHIVDESNYKDLIGIDGDALITNCSNISIGIFTADCVPLILVDKANKITAVIHAGWKGTDKKIVKEVISHMVLNMGTDPINILAAIGPSIGSCCFEVNSDVASNFHYVTKKYDKYYVDLWKENIAQLNDCSVSTANISCSNICTACNTDNFFSYRAEHGRTGRMGTFIEII